jgi:hypothetical protein
MPVSGARNADGVIRNHHTLGWEKLTLKLFFEAIDDDGRKKDKHPD